MCRPDLSRKNLKIIFFVWEVINTEFWNKTLVVLVEIMPNGITNNSGTCVKALLKIELSLS